YLIAILETLQIEPSFPEATYYIQVPSGYESAHSVALGAIERDLFHTVRYVNPPQPENSLLPAVTVHEALADLPPITAHLQGQMPRGIRKFDMIAPYVQDLEPSAYALQVRGWPGYESQAGV